MGPSTDTTSQAQCARQWNLASRSDRWGSTVRYGYNEFPRTTDGLLGRNAEQRVGAGGLPYTKAVYPTSITDLFGRTITFAYGDMTFTPAAQEYMDPHTALTPAAAPATPPANLGTPNAYQDRYETLFLDSVAVANEHAELLYTLNFAYDGPVAVTAPTGPPAVTGAKRYLSAVIETNSAGQTLPCYSFDYATDPTTSPNLGALSRITYPQGAAGELSYATATLTACKRKIPIKAPSQNATPSVFYGDDYVVTVWVSEDGSTVTLDVYTWVGRWERWRPAAPIYESTSDPADRNTIQADTSHGVFALSFARSSGKIDVVRLARDRNISTQWSMATPVEIDASSVALSAGSSFVVATSDESLHVYTWDWRTGDWSDAQSTFSDPVFAIARDEVYITATASQKDTKVAISWIDAVAAWHTGCCVSLPSVTGFNDRRSIVWDLEGNTLALTFAEDHAGDYYTVQLLRWDAGYTLSCDTFSSLPGRQLDFGHAAWPPQPVVASPRFVGVRQHLFRFEQTGWRQDGFDDLSGAPRGSWLAYAYGPDVAVQVFNDTSDAHTSVVSYDPDAAAFVTFAVTTGLPPNGGDVSVLGYPSVSGDYLVARNAVFFRGSSGDWRSAVDAGPVHQLPASSNGQSVSSLSVANGAPDYLAYLSTDPDPSKNAVQLLVLRNGAVAATPPALTMTSYTVPESVWSGWEPGQAPIGPGSFVTYPAGVGGFAATQSFDLCRYAGDALSGPITTYPVQAILIADGFGGSYDTAYEFDGDTAACDPSGKVVKYFRSASYSGTSDPSTGVLGRTVYSFENGYSLGSRYAMLDGLLIQTVGCSGAMLFHTAWLDSFGLSHDTTAQKVSAALQSAFTDGGHPLTAGAVVAWVRIDGVYEFWLVHDGDTAYTLDATSTRPGGQLRVFNGGPVQSVTTTWEVFTSRGDRQLYGGYARPTQTVARKEGVPVTTAYTYADGSGLTETKSWSVSNGSGAHEDHVETSVYGASIYRAMEAANLLSPVVALFQTVTVDGVTRTTSSSATTWRGWPQTSGAGLTVLAPAENWGWIGDPSGRDTGEFPFGEEPGANWRRRSQVTQISEAGLVLESLDAGSIRHSTLYDPAGQVPVASLTNGSFTARQACYSGFEAYEDSTPWTLSRGATIASANAHTGSACLNLPAGASATLTTLTPDGVRPAIFSAWVCTSSDFVAGASSGWTLTLESGKVTLPFEATDGLWSYQSVAVPPTTSVAIAVQNGSATVLVDDVAFVPLTAEYAARVYDGVFRLPSAKLDEAGHTTRTYRDGFMREIGGSTPTDVPSSLQLKYFSAAGNVGGFAPGDPNATIGVKAFVDGSYANPCDWSIQPADAISYTSGLFVHEAEAAAAALTLSRPAVANFALYFETLPVGSGPLALTADFSIRAGTATFTLSASTGQWSIGTGGFAGPLRSCLLVQTGDQLMLWANGKLIGSTAAVGAAKPSVVTGANALAISNLILLVEPAVRVMYSDATGAERQNHLVTADDYVVRQTIRDARAEVVVTTKSAPGLFGFGAALAVPAYRPNFASLEDLDGTAMMKGDVAAWYDGTNDTDDGGYPYTRIVLEPSPLARPLECGFAGARHAIVDYGHSPPSARATPQFAYGANTASTVPWLDLEAGKYGTASRLTPSKVETITVTDATNGAVGRFTPNAGTTFLSALATTFGGGDQSVATTQPNAFALGEKGEVESRTKNALQQLTKDVSPDGGTSRYMYDAAGRIRFLQGASAAADGILVYFRWDALGRIIARGFADFDWSPSTAAQLQAFADDDGWPENQTTSSFTQQRSWLWDGDGSDPTDIGQLVQRRAVTGSTVVTEELSWDAAGRPAAREVSIDDGSSRRRFTTAFRHDLRGRLASVTYPNVAGLDFTSVHYTHDGRDNVTSITDEQGLAFVEYEYNAEGRPTAVRLASGAVAGTQAYDSTGRETMLKLTAAQGSYQSTLGYDADSMLASLQETLQPAVQAFDAEITYTYDTLGRLKSAVDANTSRSLALDFTTKPSGVVDQNGNIQSLSDPAGDTTLDYTAGTNQVATQTVHGVASTCRYAPNGALLQRGSQLTIDYVPGTLLPASVTAPTETMSCAYDAGGSCVARTTGAGPAAVDVLAGFESPIVTVDEDGTCRAFVYGPLGPVAMATGSKRYGVLCDTLRTPRIVWDDSGQLVAAYAYGAYGARTASHEPATGFLPFGFTGKRFYPASGLYDFRTRLYDPAIGRFLAPDPAAQFPSSYCYAGNLPTLLIDPNGQLTAIEAGAVDAALALALIVAIIVTGGAASAAIPLVAAGEGGMLAAVATGAAIGAAGGAVSNAAFQGLWYGITTPPGDWDWTEFGREVGAGAIGGAAGGLLTGALAAPFLVPAGVAASAAADTAVAAAENTAASSLLAADSDDDLAGLSRSRSLSSEEEEKPIVPERNTRPDPGQAPAQSAWERLGRPILANTLSQAVGGSLRGGVTAGLTNVFDGREVQDPGLSALIGFVGGAAGGAFGGTLGAYNVGSRVLASLTSAYDENPVAVITIGAIAVPSIYVFATGAFCVRTATYPAKTT
jgi:RHS repeat-associated protein